MDIKNFLLLKKKTANTEDNKNKNKKNDKSNNHNPTKRLQGGRFDGGRRGWGCLVKEVVSLDKTVMKEGLLK